MRLILHHAQQELGSWVGSSVIHLGDTNVPNALTFIGTSAPSRESVVAVDADLLVAKGRHRPPLAIPYLCPSDKYTQVSRILAPIVQTLRQIPEMEKKPQLASVRLVLGARCPRMQPLLARFPSPSQRQFACDVPIATDTLFACCCAVHQKDLWWRQRVAVANLPRLFRPWL